jgi:hypothetical protein
MAAVAVAVVCEVVALNWQWCLLLLLSLCWLLSVLAGSQARGAGLACPSSWVPSHVVAPGFIHEVTGGNFGERGN